MFTKIRQLTLLTMLVTLIFATNSVQAKSAAEELTSTPTPGAAAATSTLEMASPTSQPAPTETPTAGFTATIPSQPTSTATPLAATSTPFPATSTSAPTAMPSTLTPTATSLPATVAKLLVVAPLPANLFPVTYTTLAGATGGQPVGVLSLQDQAGSSDNPAAYVLFDTPQKAYLGTQSFQFPGNLQTTTAQTLTLTVNYKGLGFAKQRWIWSLYNQVNQAWVVVGNNQNAVENTWTRLSFQVAQPEQFISPTGQILAQLYSNNFAGQAKIDYETLYVTYGAALPVSTATLTPLKTSVPATAVLTPTKTNLPALATSTPTKTSVPATPVLTATKTSLPATVTSMPTKTSLPLTATFTPAPTQVRGGQVYYVAKTGSNVNPGTLAQPWLTIQKCLDQVQPGASCEILGGLYAEALVLKNSGTQAARITLKNYNNQVVTVNSGSSKTIVTGGRVDYYTIEGLRLIASFTPANQSDVSVDFGKNVPFSATSTSVGNHGFILRNCYLEGAIHFYGHSNLVENCELNGKSLYHNAIIENFATSNNNIYRNNTIHHYLVRGVWSMNATSNLLVDGNTIYDVQYGIDCDGAAVAISGCRILNNHIYNVGARQWGTAVFLENCFNCVVQGNTIHDLQNGPGIYAINYGNGDSTGWHTLNNLEYRNRASNTRISQNLIYSYKNGAGIFVTSVSGLVIDQNTFYTVSTYPAIGLHAEQDAAGVTYLPKDETITNNLFYKTGAKWFSATSGLVSAGNFTGDPGFVNPPVDFHLKANSPACTAGIGGKYAGVFACQ